jgi:tripeptidyl-peptidase-1
VGSTLGINPERAINFTGGGFSNYFARPWWQNTIIPPYLTTVPPDFAGTFNRSGRGYPDVRPSRCKTIDQE